MYSLIRKTENQYFIQNWFSEIIHAWLGGHSTVSRLGGTVDAIK